MPPDRPGTGPRRMARNEALRCERRPLFLYLWGNRFEDAGALATGGPCVPRRARMGRLACAAGVHCERGPVAASVGQGPAAQPWDARHLMAGDVGSEIG